MTKAERERLQRLLDQLDDIVKGLSSLLWQDESRTDMPGDRWMEGIEDYCSALA